ncbi:T9SS type A sorting domain-containing protein [Flavobacterium sp. UBA7680]|uniref:T9SS type A sorting domain-containing protein n=1 Tax=Flavobacterium sp. UBA7680 TaxID=1946559 RepID=UPI0025BD1CC9|nr:T9SS type A sorting domain-containing protein [Flavobacterium sp. UBA7680]
MKKQITILLALLSTIFGMAQTPPPVQWQVDLGGAGYDLPSTIQQTTDGGYIVTGYSNSQDGDLTGSTHYGTGAAHNLWIVKLDGNGAITWKKTYGIADNDYQSISASIRQTNDGGYIVVGTAETWGQFTNYLVMKIDSTGNVAWANNNIGGNAFDIATSVWQTTDNGYIIAGYTAGNLASQGAYDYNIVKLDSSGAVQWNKVMGGSGNEYTSTIQQTADGGYIIGGSTTSNNGDVSGNHGGTDGWLVKLDPTGTTIQWQKTYGGTGDDNIYSLQQTTDGGYILGGSTTSNNGDVSGNHGSSDAWVMKLDNLGNATWGKCFGSTNEDEVNEIRQTNDGGYIVACAKNANSLASESWTLKLDASGNTEWEKIFSGSNIDENYSAQKTSDNGYILLLSSKSNDLDYVGAHGDNDYWVVKLLAGEQQDACINWHLTDDQSVSSVNGNITGISEIIQPPLQVFDYNGGQRLRKPHPTGGWGWSPSGVIPSEYIEFNTSPATGNDLTVTNISFNYNDNLAPNMDFNIIYFDVAYSTDNWANSTSLGTGIVYKGTSVQTFSASVNTLVANGGTFSLRIFPYSPNGSIAATPTLAIHSYVNICGKTQKATTSYSAKICGAKFNDENNNGVWDNNEVGIPNWQINLASVAGNQFQTTLTDENGDYCFENVSEGDFHITETQQPEWTQTYPSDNTYHLVQTMTGGNYFNVDFGNKQTDNNSTPEEKCLINYLTEGPCGGYTPDNMVNDGCSMGMGFDPIMYVSGYDAVFGQKLTVNGWQSGSYDSNRYVAFNAKPLANNTLTVTNVSFEYSELGVTDNAVHGYVEYLIGSGSNWTNYFLGNIDYSTSGVQTFTAQIPNGAGVVPDGQFFILKIYLWATQDEGSDPFYPTHRNVTICGTSTENTLSLGSQNMLPEISMYPNPAENVVYINNLSSSSTVSIFDLTGKVIYSQSANEQTAVDTSNFAKGIYIVQIESNGKKEHKKLIVK